MIVTVLPCDHCEDRESKVMHNGSLVPQTIGGSPHGGFPLKVHCMACRQKTSVSAAKFSSLRKVDEQEVFGLSLAFRNDSSVESEP